MSLSSLVEYEKRRWSDLQTQSISGTGLNSPYWAFKESCRTLKVLNKTFKSCLKLTDNQWDEDVNNSTDDSWRDCRLHSRLEAVPHQVFLPAVVIRGWLRVVQLRHRQYHLLYVCFGPACHFHDAASNTLIPPTRPTVYFIVSHWSLCFCCGGVVFT